MIPVPFKIFKADGTKLVDDSKIELNLNAPNQDTVNTDAEAENVAMASDFLKIQEKLQSEDGVLEKMEKGIRSTLDYQNTETSEHCIICLENYARGQELISGIKCSHTFHANCLMGWLEKHDVCPVCRKPMITPSEYRTYAVKILDQKRIQQLVQGFHQEKEYEAELDLLTGYPIEQKQEVDVSQTAMYAEVQEQMNIHL